MLDVKVNAINDNYEVGYLAFYKGVKKLDDFNSYFIRGFEELTKCVTRSKFSHVELAFKSEDHDGLYDCYSSSMRDGGVRAKVLDLSDTSKWELVPVIVNKHAALQYFMENEHCKYDYLALLATSIPFWQMTNRFICSEFAFNAVGLSDSDMDGIADIRDEGWRFSPGDLYVIFKSIAYHNNLFDVECETC